MACALACGTGSAEEAPQWLTDPGGDGPGKGKHIVLIAADQEYRSEQSMPMMAKILSKHHGIDCTVLFAVNDKGEVDPTMPVHAEKGKELKEHHIPGLEKLAQTSGGTRMFTGPTSRVESLRKKAPPHHRQRIRPRKPMLERQRALVDEHRQAVRRAATEAVRHC